MIALPVTMIARFAFTALVTLAAACTSSMSPELRVITVQNRSPHEVVYVQVTNPAKRPMRLTKLEYTFAAGASKVSEGELELSRDVPAESAIVVEVPFEGEASNTSLTLKGKLTA